MIEFLWIGRGGQGAFTAAKLLGAAYTEKGDNYHSLSFPSFGPERRGAPVRAFTKLDNKPILDRSQTEKADYIVILAETLYDDNLQNLIKDNGKIIINSKTVSGKNIIAFDGSHYANELRLPTVNTVMLGAVSGFSKIVSTDELTLAIGKYMPKKIQEKNIKAVLEAAVEVIG